MVVLSSKLLILGGKIQFFFSKLVMVCGHNLAENNFAHTNLEKLVILGGRKQFSTQNG